MIRNEKYRVPYFVLGLIIVAIGFLMKGFYRPLVKSGDFFDFGLANSSPSLFYVIGFSLLLSFNKHFKVIYLIVTVTMGSILYEYYQSLGNHNFDFSDTIYSIIGGGLTIVIHNQLKKYTKEKQIECRH